jgi:hypothetical protein
MKTPREIILGRHQAAEASLDAIRQQVLSRELPPRPQPVEQLPSGAWLTTLWDQLVLPCKRAWAGFGFAWVVILLLQATSSNPMSKPSLPSGKPSLDDRAQLREQWQLRAEMLGTATPDLANSGPVPGPQSEVRPGWDFSLRRHEEAPA